MVKGGTQKAPWCSSKQDLLSQLPSRKSYFPARGGASSVTTTTQGTRSAPKQEEGPRRLGMQRTLRRMGDEAAPHTLFVNKLSRQLASNL